MKQPQSMQGSCCAWTNKSCRATPKVSVFCAPIRLPVHTVFQQVSNGKPPNLSITSLCSGEEEKGSFHCRLLRPLQCAEHSSLSIMSAPTLAKMTARGLVAMSRVMRE